jgi:hypothetical protein
MVILYAIKPKSTGEDYYRRFYPKIKYKNATIVKIADCAIKRSKNAKIRRYLYLIDGRSLLKEES